MKKTLMACAIATALCGCGSMIQAVNAYGSIVVADARAANDTVIAGWTLAACATPISAALRNPHIIPAIKALCMPPGDAAPADLLNPSQRAGRE